MMMQDKTVKAINDLHSKEDERNFKRMRRKEFSRLLTGSKINILKLFTRKSTLQEKHIFNHFLRIIKMNNNFKLGESLVFIEEEYENFKKIINCLDDQNAYMLKEEMLKNNKYIKVQRTKLLNFLIEEEMELFA